MTNSNQPNQFHIQHVISPLPVFTTVLEDYETINKELKHLILEHDAVMVKQYLRHNYLNNIVYLGGSEQLEGGTLRSDDTIPPHASDHQGLDRFICRAHAYSIDPIMAKNLVSYAIHHGIITTADAMMRYDMFGIVQDGVYAYDSDHGLSTIDQSNLKII